MELGARTVTAMDVLQDRPLRHLSRGAAFAVLAVLAMAMAWAAWSTTTLASADAEHRATAHAETAIGDFELYARIADRVAVGEDYYAAAMTEQRANNYPTAPFVTVRLPTLAWINARLGAQGTGALAIGLLLANVLAWYVRLGKAAGPAARVALPLLVLAGGVFAFEPRAGLLHELVAGLLVSLALALWRPDRWWLALVPLALALAVRELALPFALLWLAFAIAGRRWREAAAVAGLTGFFALGLVLHAEGVAAHASPLDRASPGWAGLAGPQLALLSLSRLSAMLVLPLTVAAPLGVLALLGWIGLGGRFGLFASLWFAGFALALALLARPANFYWVMLVLPAYMAGLALVPRALGDLVHSVRTSQS